MNKIKNLQYREKMILNDEMKYQEYRQQISLSKHYSDDDPLDRYYLKTDIIDLNQKLVHQGYLYFYLDFEHSLSSFIGSCVEDQFRNSKIASLLISSWIKLCLDHGINNLETIPKQRKPFLLHLLKKYTFEIENQEEYLTSKNVVHICRKGKYTDKYLIFVDKREEEMFKRSNIMKTDNYKIVDNDDECIQVIDSVALYHQYFLQDNEKAYQKSLKTIEDIRYRRM